MSAKPRILLDCDGPLADFAGRAVRSINRLAQCATFPPGTQPVEWDFGDLLRFAGVHKSRFWEALNDVGVARNLEPQPHAQELVDEMSKLGEVWVVTSPMDSNPTWCYERLQWLREHLGVDKHRVVFASDKSAVDGVVLIDDRAANLEQWEAGEVRTHDFLGGSDDPMRRGILWEQPYSGPWDGSRVRCVAAAVVSVEMHLRALRGGGR